MGSLFDQDGVGEGVSVGGISIVGESVGEGAAVGVSIVFVGVALTVRGSMVDDGDEVSVGVSEIVGVAVSV